MKKLNKYLFLLITCALLFTSCKVCKTLGIIDDQEQSQVQKVVNGKIVEVDSSGEIKPSSKGYKINVGYLVWWVAVFTVIALGVRHYMRKNNE